MSPGELRSPCATRSGSFLPIPVEQAGFRLRRARTGEPGAEGATTRLLWPPLSRDIVKEAIGVVKRGGLRSGRSTRPRCPVTGFPARAGWGARAVVCLRRSIGGVGVRQARRLASYAPVTLNSARNQPGCPRAAQAVMVPTRPAEVSRRRDRAPPGPVVEEVRSSIEYFLSHNQGEHLERVVVTGGAALTSRARRAHPRRAPCARDAGHGGSPRRWRASSVSDEQMQEASVRWATAVGLALWKTAPGPAPSLLPAEIKERLHVQQALLGSAAG